MKKSGKNIHTAWRSLTVSLNHCTCTPTPTCFHTEKSFDTEIIMLHSSTLKCFLNDNGPSSYGTLLSFAFPSLFSACCSEDCIDPCLHKKVRERRGAKRPFTWIDSKVYNVYTTYSLSYRNLSKRPVDYN